MTILVKEVDERLKSLVNQCREFANEIVLITNKGSKITVPHTRTVEFEWCDDFSAARNFAFEQCKGDYIMWLDADDEIEGAEKIKDYIKEVEKNNIDWVAMPYVYMRSIGATQYKERIFKKGTVKWEKTIHENPVETRSTNKVICEDITILHLKTMEEAEQAQERNLKYLLAEYNRDKDKTDPRTLLYIGRTLTGIGQKMALRQEEHADDVMKKANAFFVDYIPKSGWDEDKYYAILDLARNLGYLGQTEEGISYALGAMRLYPQWNKAYFELGGLYLRSNPAKAIEFIKTGLSKQTPKTMLLVNSYEETVMPIAQMAEACLMTGKIDDAYKLIDKLKDTGNSNIDELISAIKDAKETEDYVIGMGKALEYISKVNRKSALDILDSLPAEIADDIRFHNFRNRTAIPKLWHKKEIAIVCPFAYEVWADPNALKGIGGSEEAVIYLSRELVKSGYKVTVYNKCRTLRGVYNGVEYRNEYELNTNDEFSTIVAWRDPEFFVRNKIKAENKWVWMHDVPIKDFTEEVIASFDKVIVLSKYHRELIANVPDDKVMLSSNGIVPEQFKGLPEKKPHTLIYSSSPDRGLECLLKDIMPLVKKEIPDAKLNVCYGWKTFDEMYADDELAMKWKEHILELEKKVDAIDHGRIGHRQLARLMGECVVHAYPTEFTEINCITVQKTQCAGCVPVTTDVAALREFNKYGVQIAGSKIYTSTVLQKQFAQEVIKQLKNPKKIDSQKAIKEFSWENVSNQWTTAIESSYARTVVKSQSQE